MRNPRLPAEDGPEEEATSRDNHPTSRWGDGPYHRPLKVVIVTQEDPFYIGTFFREFLGNLNSHREIVEVLGVMVQPSLGSARRVDLARRVWQLYGTLGFIRMLFRYAWAKIAGSGIEKYCRDAGVAILSFEPEQSVGGKSGAQGRPPVANNANGPSFHRWLREEEIDLVVSVSASQIFGRTLLSIPKIGCVNLHNAPLPRYRGMLPNFRQMFDGESASVLTIHEMVRELDKGDILFRSATPIEPSMSLEDLMARTKENSARALWDFLREVYRGTATRRPLSGEGSYYTWPTRKEAREFRRRGYRVW